MLSVPNTHTHKAIKIKEKKSKPINKPVHFRAT